MTTGGSACAPKPSVLSHRQYEGNARREDSCTHAKSQRRCGPEHAKCGYVRHRPFESCESLPWRGYRYTPALCERMTTGSARSTARIKQLDTRVVNQIAAGEVIQRPSSALKELLENAVDSGATSINILVVDGGLKLLQVKDNGCGIAKDDLAVLCRRHTTSKLSTFEDLSRIETLGFRGEALCSISFASRLSVVTMREGDEVGWKGTFRDGDLVCGPQPCAAVPGTCMLAEDLFYNAPTRRRALASAAEEHKRIVDVVARHAVYHTGVGITLKRGSSVKADVLTLPHFTRRDAVGAAFGTAIAHNTVPITVSAAWGASHAAGPADGAPLDGPTFSADALLSSPNVSAKRSTLVLFVNGRSIHCAQLKSALDGVYGALHSKAAAFFAFVDIRMPAAHVDVNIHPTKAEVAMLYQGEVIEAIRAAASDALAQGQDVRGLSMPVPPAPTVVTAESQSGQRSASRSSQQPSLHDGVRTQRARSGGDHKLVRTDHRDRSLLPFVESDSRARPGPDDETAARAGSIRRKGASKRPRNVGGLQSLEVAPEAAVPHEHATVPQCDVPAVQVLLQRVEAATHYSMTRAIREHKLVGALGPRHALLQHGTQLYLVDTSRLSADLFYQQALRMCHSNGTVALADAPALADLVGIGLEARAAQGLLTDADGPQDELCAMITQLLRMHAPFLRDAFGVHIDDSSGTLLALPRLAAGYAPDTDALPDFCVALAAEVDWRSEESRYEVVAQLLGELYRIDDGRFLDPEPDPPVQEQTEPLAVSSRARAVLEHVLLPAMRRDLAVPCERATDGAFVQLAALEQLYKVFERC